MKKILPSVVLFLACIFNTSAQQNCSNPLNVSLCPPTTLTNQTNAGMLNDVVNPCNIAGEDLVYRMVTSATTQRMYVSFTNVTSTMKMSLQSGTCGGGGCSSWNVYSGNSNFTINVLANTTYFLWIDAGITVTYNIAFGGDTSYTWINIPNTQGNWGFETTLCAVPPFKSTKPFLQVKYNGVFQTDPMTLAPLNVPGTICVVNYLKNTTGVKGAKKFVFYYNPLGFPTFAPSQMIVPGFYNPGNWFASFVVNRWEFIFVDSAGTGKGDFTGTPNTCLRYEFCFDVTPISNDPVKTNIRDSIYSDNLGAGFSGWVRSGCCPPGFANCLGNSGGSGSAGSGAIGTDFGDPGGFLPIVLLQFSAKPKNDFVEVEWTTASELNNDYFTVEKSPDGNEWTVAKIIEGAGSSTSPLSYAYTDHHPFPATSYYRLKQTDFDGTSSYSNPVAVKLKNIFPITVYPNPTSGEVIVSGFDLSNDANEIHVMRFTFSNLMGKHLMFLFLNTMERYILISLTLQKECMSWKLNRKEIPPTIKSFLRTDRVKLRQ